MEEGRAVHRYPTFPFPQSVRFPNTHALTPSLSPRRQSRYKVYVESSSHVRAETRSGWNANRGGVGFDGRSTVKESLDSLVGSPTLLPSISDPSSGVPFDPLN